MSDLRYYAKGRHLTCDDKKSIDSVGQRSPAAGGRAGVSRPDDLFCELFGRYYSPVRSFFLRRGFTGEEAADLAQETFTRAYQRLDTLRERESARSWLFAVAINVLRNSLRSLNAAKRSGEEVPFDEAAEPAGETQATPSARGMTEETALDELLTREREELLRRALDELPPRMRQAVLLRVGHELRYREIAELQQVSVDTIKAQMLQARRRLRERLGEHFSHIDF